MCSRPPCAQRFMPLCLFISSLWPARWRTPLSRLTLMELSALTLRVLRGGRSRWASSNNFCHLRVNPFQFPLYLQCRLNKANSPSPLLNDAFSIDCAQTLAGLPKDSDHPMVSSMISAAQGILERPRVKKRPCCPRDVESPCAVKNDNR